MNIIAHPDIDVVGSISRDEDGTLSVRLAHIEDETIREKFRIFVDNKMIYGKKRKPKPLPPIVDEDVIDYE